MCIQVSVSNLKLGQLYGVLSIQGTKLELLAGNMSVCKRTLHEETCMTFGACVDTDSFIMMDVGTVFPGKSDEPRV